VAEVTLTLYDGTTWLEQDTADTEELAGAIDHLFFITGQALPDDEDPSDMAERLSSAAKLEFSGSIDLSNGLRLELTKEGS
jgi:hypothetical protein